MKQNVLFEKVMAENNRSLGRFLNSPSAPRKNDLQKEICEHLQSALDLCDGRPGTVYATVADTIRKAIDEVLS